MKDGQINLATVREFTGKTPSNGELTIQMKSTNLSASTTFSFQLSLNGVGWGTAQENGTDITDTLVVNVDKIKSFSVVPDILFKIKFDGVTTGIVTYTYTDN